VYEAYLDRADRMVLTEIPERPEGDTHFPEWDPEAWVERDRETDGELAFVTYERRDGE
jgi:dihydrofolate reductase